MSSGEWSYRTYAAMLLWMLAGRDAINSTARKEEYTSCKYVTWWFPRRNTSKEISVLGFFTTITAVKIDKAVTTKDKPWRARTTTVPKRARAGARFGTVQATSARRDAEADRAGTYTPRRTRSRGRHADPRHHSRGCVTTAAAGGAGEVEPAADRCGRSCCGRTPAANELRLATPLSPIFSSPAACPPLVPSAHLSQQPEKLW